jgi:hypothetical protein
MKNLFLLIAILSLGACSWFSKKEEVPNKPLPACVQQVEPRNPEIPCKIGDWWAPGHTKCSTSKELCEKK